MTAGPFMFSFVTEPAPHNQGNAQYIACHASVTARSVEQRNRYG